MGRGRCAEAGKGSCAGEAPEEGSAFRARARRCQACLQHFLSRACPLFVRGLALGARALALGDALHYAAAALCVPAALAVPLATALTRAFPLLLTWQWLAAAVPYLALTLAGALSAQSLWLHWTMLWLQVSLALLSVWLDGAMHTQTIFANALDEKSARHLTLLRVVVFCEVV